jgi:acyl carrier protein
MDNQTLREKIIDSLLDVAPDLANRTLDDKALLAEEYSLDSADFLTYVIKIHERFGVDIPAEVYSSFATIEGAVDYLRKHVDTN